MDLNEAAEHLDRQARQMEAVQTIAAWAREVGAVDKAKAEALDRLKRAQDDLDYFTAQAADATAARNAELADLNARIAAATTEAGEVLERAKRDADAMAAKAKSSADAMRRDAEADGKQIIANATAQADQKRKNAEDDAMRARGEREESITDRDEARKAADAAKAELTAYQERLAQARAAAKQAMGE